MWRNLNYFEVAAWWPQTGSYGSSERYGTVEEAITERNRMLSLGYPNVHIRKVVVAVNQETMTTEPEPNLRRKMAH